MGIERRSPGLSDRAVAVATLSRQHLLRRTDLGVTDVVEHLSGLQAQAPFPPYFGLWSRIDGFVPDDLSALLESAAIVRIVLMRGTVHLVTARDAAFLRPLVQPIMDRDLLRNPQHGRALTGVDLEAVAAHASEVFANGPLTTTELGAQLARCFPTVPPSALVHAVRGLVPVVQTPPRGIWGKSGQVRLLPFEQWTGRPLDRHPTVEKLVLRYLNAFGPATVADLQAWSGLTRLAEVVDRLRPQLTTFTAESGAQLYDLPDAPRPDPDVEVPTRIVAAFDNLLLAHADRSRVISTESRAKLFTVNGIFPPVALVDGTVAAAVKLTDEKGHAVLTVTPYRRLSKAHRASITAEGRRMATFARPDHLSFEVQFSEVV